MTLYSIYQYNISIVIEEKTVWYVGKKMEIYEIANRLCADILKGDNTRIKEAVPQYIIMGRTPEQTKAEIEREEGSGRLSMRTQENARDVG